MANNALQLAAENGSMSIVKLLIEEKKIPIHIKYNNGYTALHNAAVKDRSEVIQYLLTRGADYKIRTNNGQLAIHKAAQGGFKNSVTTFIEHDNSLIKEKGCGKEGKTILILAVESLNIDLVKYLVEVAGCPLNETSNEGNTALHYAAVQFDKEVLSKVSMGTVHCIWRYLIEKGEDCFSAVNNRKGETPYEKLPFGKDLKQMLQEAFCLKLSIKDMGAVEILKKLRISFPWTAIQLDQKAHDFWDEMQEKEKEKADDWNDKQLAFREFLYLYDRYCM